MHGGEVEVVEIKTELGAELAAWSRTLSPQGRALDHGRTVPDRCTQEIPMEEVGGGGLCRDRSHGKALLEDRLRHWGSVRQGSGYLELSQMLPSGPQGRETAKTRDTCLGCFSSFVVLATSSPGGVFWGLGSSLPGGVCVCGVLRHPTC